VFINSEDTAGFENDGDDVKLHPEPRAEIWCSSFQTIGNTSPKYFAKMIFSISSETGYDVVFDAPIPLVEIDTFIVAKVMNSVVHAIGSVMYDNSYCSILI
jgi:hypothetical protein